MLKVDCPNKASHTPCPEGYREWDEWVDNMQKTHYQIRCPCCGLFKIWLPNTERKRTLKEFLNKLNALQSEYKLYLSAYDTVYVMYEDDSQEDSIRWDRSEKKYVIDEDF